MTKYATIRGQLLSGNTVDYLAKTVFESDRTPIATGLIDASGVPIYRVEEIQPIGFIRIPAK